MHGFIYHNEQKKPEGVIECTHNCLPHIKC